ncbi:MAG: endolytic transglycosylase MltG [Candidatus Aminicenantes bacterium]|nr:MAG: endolytic transglycosylase MltG [Candidatus Aminicenantes bacterium]
MIFKVIKTALIISAVIPLILSAWFSFEFYSTPKVTPQKIFFVVEEGNGVQSIAQNLKEQGIIKKTWPFLLGYKIYFSSMSLKAGEYELSLPVSTKKILRILSEGKVYFHPVTIPEGLTRREIAQHLDSLGIVDEEDFLEACSRTELLGSYDIEAENLEGYLFPETYHFTRGTSAETIVSTLVSQFKSVFTEEWRKRAIEINMTPRKVVTLASLIEKETSIPEERELVSAVFHTRLRIRMKLDCDPTIIYAMKEQGIYEGRLLRKHLKLDTPYNTYLRRGLPPGPICNPGKAALEAALYPSKEKYIYFVSKNDGSHVFSRTFKEHQRAVIKYQRQRQ